MSTGVPVVVAKPIPGQTGRVLVTLLATVAVLHFAEDVLVPVALALLLAFLLAPLVNRVERTGANRGVAVLTTTVIAFALIAAIVYVVANQFLRLVGDLPTHRDNLMQKVHAVSRSSGGGLDRGVETVKELTDELQKSAPGQTGSSEISKVQIVEPPPNVTQVLRGLFGPLIGPVSTAAIVVVFVIFMLLQREDLRDRLVRLLGASEMHNTLTALDDAASRVSRYLLMQTLINSVQGLLVAIGLYFIGLPDALLWGALTIVLRFVPYLGPALAAAGPIILSLAVFGTWSQPLLVVGLILGLELISNNVFEPRLYGSSVGVSSFALLVAAVFWTWLWGVAGLFLATPLTVCLVVLGKYIPQLSFLGVLLGDEPVLTDSERFYQRLLANDPEEAQGVLDDAAEAGSLLDVCDTILLPALRFVEHDHDRGAIDGARRQAIVAQIGEMIEDLPPGRADTVEAERSVPTIRMSVLFMPAADQADEFAARLLARVLERHAIDAEVLSIATLKGEMLEHAADTRPHVLFISAAPPAAVIHARYLAKKLRTAFPGGSIVIGLWDAQGDLAKARERLQMAGADKVVTTATEAVEELVRLHQPLLQGVQRGPEEASLALLPVAR